MLLFPKGAVVTVDSMIGANRASDLFTIHQLAGELEDAHIEIAQLKRALRNGRTIGMAIGMLAERHHLCPARAFRLLVRASQYSNRKVRDISLEIVRDGKTLDSFVRSKGRP